MFPLRALLVLACAYFTMGTASFAIIGLVPGLSRDLGVSAAAIATLVTVYALVFAVAAPASQILLAGRKRLRILQMGLVLTALGLAAGAAAPDHLTLTLSRIVLALGGAMVGPTASAIATGLVGPTQRGRAIAIVFSGMSIATVMGVPLSAFAGETIGWRWVFAVLAGLALAAAAAAEATVRDDGAGGRLRLRELLGILAAPSRNLVFATTLVQMCAQFATYTLIGPYLIEVVGIGAAAVPAMLMVFGVGGVLGNALAGPSTDRFGAIPTLTGSLVGIGICFAILALLPGLPWIAIGAFILWSVCGFLFQTPQQKRVAELDPERRGLMLALNAASLYLGVSLGSAIGSAAYLEGGPALLPWASLGLILIAGLLYAASLRAARR